MDNDKQSQTGFNEDFLRKIEYLEGFIKISRRWSMLIRGETSIDDLKKTIEEAFKHREKVPVKKVKKKPSVKKAGRKKKRRSSRKK